MTISRKPAENYAAMPIWCQVHSTHAFERQFSTTHQILILTFAVQPRAFLSTTLSALHVARSSHALKVIRNAESRDCRRWRSWRVLRIALALRRSADEVILVNRTRARSDGIATDITYEAALGDLAMVRSAVMSDLADCSVVLLTAGVNEKAGGAMDRRDTEGRLRLLRANARDLS